MEKIIAALWAPEEESREAYGARLLQSLPRALANAGASGIRLNIRDEAVAPADGLCQTWQTPQQAAVAQFWLPSSHAMFRGEIDAALASHSARFAAWLVCESTVIPNVDHPSQPGERSWGWSQCSFITFRSDMTKQQGIDRWHSHHTRVATDTQSNFEYVQNLVVLALTKDAPAYDAFVEECFPAGAMTDQAVLYDAVGDQAKHDAHLKEMMESCASFLDFARMDIIPTSQFDFAEQDHR